MVAFVIFLVWMSKVDSSKDVYQYLFRFWLGDIIVGIVAFLTMIFASVNSGNNLAKELKKEEKKIEKVVIKQAPSFWMIVSIVLLVIVAYMLGSRNSSFLGFSMSATPTPTQTQVFVDCVINGQVTRAAKDVCDSFGKSISPTVAPQRTYSNTSNNNPKIDCVGPDGKHLSVTQDECNKFNNAWKNPQDQIVNCKMQTSCGGQVLQITKKECDTIVCCEVDGKWSTYPNNDSCRNAQNRSSGSNTQTYKDTTAYWDCVGRAQDSKHSYVMSYCITGDDTFYTCSALAESQYQSALKICESLK
jgi:hypothetical protein